MERRIEIWDESVQEYPAPTQLLVTHETQPYLVEAEVVNGAGIDVTLRLESDGVTWSATVSEIRMREISHFLTKPLLPGGLKVVVAFLDDCDIPYLAVADRVLDRVRTVDVMDVSDDDTITLEHVQFGFQIDSKWFLAVFVVESDFDIRLFERHLRRVAREVLAASWSEEDGFKLSIQMTKAILSRLHETLDQVSGKFMGYMYKCGE